jgi:CheY-like chemotaxis protein
MRILLIEDEPRAAALLKGLLEHDGHSVVHVPTAEQAIPMAARFLPELVISDYYLPGGMNGAEAAQHIRLMIPSAHLIMVTGYPLEEVIAQSLPAKPLAVFEKPVEYEPLSRLIQNITMH